MRNIVCSRTIIHYETCYLEHVLSIPQGNIYASGPLYLETTLPVQAVSMAAMKVIIFQLTDAVPASSDRAQLILLFGGTLMRLRISA